MPRTTRKALSLGALVSLLVALLAFIARAAGAQESAPQPLSLGDAARLAARQSAPVEAAILRASQAEQRVRQRRADLLPDFSGAASQTRHTVNSASFGFDFPTPPGEPPLLDPNGEIIGPVDLTDFRGRGAQTLLDLAAVQRVRSARSQASASHAEASNQGQLAAAQAASSYLRALRSEAQLQARLADSVLASDLLGIARAQLDAGVGVALDVTRAQSQLASIRAQLIGARGDRDRARLELLRTVNLPLDTPLELTDSLDLLAPAELPASEEAAVEQAMRDRADVRALDEQIHAAQQQIVAIRAERLPTVGVFGDDGLLGKDPSHLLNTYQVGVQLSLPIFDGFRREARVEEQSLAARELEVRRRDLRQQVAVEVRSALLDLETTRQQVAASRERLALAETELSQARERFSTGVAGNADVITAQLSLNAARTQLIDALTAYQGARVAYARAEGSLTTLP
jgi:outer membrane protein